MSASDEDHNYYSQGYRRQLPDYNLDRQHSSAADPAPDESLPTLPALHYRQSQQHPKQPIITTNLENHASNGTVHRSLIDRPKLDPSPDPHEFYRQYRDSFTRDGTGTHGGSNSGSGHQEQGMNATRSSQRPTPVTARTNDYGPPLSSRWAGRIEERRTQSPLSERPSVSNKASAPGSHNVLSGRQTSLQALVNKFNQTPDEVPPLPIGSDSRSTSTNPSPSSSKASRSFRARTSAEHVEDRPTAPSRIQTQTRDGLYKQATPSDGRIFDAGKGSGSNRSPRKTQKAFAITGNAFATQSMIDLSPEVSHPPRKPLFGEILKIPGHSDLGYGIPGPRLRRGSEGSTHYPSPMFHDDTAFDTRTISPSSPTAWYMGVTPSLEGIDLDKPVPARRPGSHGRSRSDIISGAHAMPPLSSSHGKKVAIMSPPQEQYSSDSSPRAGKRDSQSRIPVSTRHKSRGSDSSGASSPSWSSGNGKRVNHRRIPSRIGTTLPMPVAPKSPDRAIQPPVPRKSPRHRNQTPTRQSSPRLQAFISEPPPLKSPPLRSSRPRQPVSSATTAASRSRAAANLGNGDSKSRDKNGKSLPELGGVDFAARRERIQRAFTTKVKEKEIETERKRMSLMQDLNWQQGASGEPSGQPDNGTSKPAGMEQRSYENLPGHEDDVFTSLPKAEPSEDRELAVDVSTSNETPVVTLIEEDSPTLGNALFLEPSRYQGGSSDEEPQSAVTSGTADTFFDHEPQQTTIPANIKEPTRPAPQERDKVLPSRPLEPHNTADPEIGSSDQERDDAESVQIMLQQTPITNNDDAARFGQEILNTVLDNTWSDAIWTSSNADGPGRRIDSPSLHRITENSSSNGIPNNAHISMSTNASTDNQSTWSPESSSSKTTVQTTRNSDSYNLNHILDDYHDSRPKNSDNSNEFQQRLFAQSPQLARHGNWDPQKVTQLYLQNSGRDRLAHASAVPEPLLRKQESASRTPPPMVLTPGGRNTRTPEEPACNGSSRDSADGGLYPDNHLSPEIPMSHRASASLSNADDWLNTSPSMLDWMINSQIDTSVEEKGAFDQGQSAAPITSYGVDKSLPVLPGIQPSGGLGIDITIQSPNDRHWSTSLSHGHPEPIDRRSSPLRSTNATKPDSSSLRSSTPASDKTKPPSLVQTNSNEASSRKASDDNPLKWRQRSRAGTESGQPSIDSASIAESAKSSAAEQKRLTRRRHILKELVDTESSFGKDMTVVVDIYKGTSNVILNNNDDARTLFGNSADIVQFSMNFLDSLKQAAKSVYVLPRGKRWKTKRDSSATSGSTTTDDQSSITGDLSDEEKDRMTSIGTAFDNNLTQMEKVYTEYLKNHDSANVKLQQLQKSEKVKIWLKECRAYAHDLTTAWDLDSLLVKPVQRILKYPLLLKELLEVTPENHPDYFALDTAAREMVGVSVRINEAKKRADLLGLVHNSIANNKAKRKENEGRLGLPKAFGRRTEKLKQQVGITDNVQDHKYNAVAERFGDHFFRLQVVMRDVEMYVLDSQKWVNKFHDYVLAIEGYLDVGQTNHTEIESKWRRFRLSAKEIQMTGLTDHIAAVRKNVIDPMTTLLKLHDGPQKLMDKRKKRVIDYAKFKTIKERGEKPDKKTTEQGEQFLAVNDTLKDELPKLFSLTGKLVEACLQNFVQLQLQWMNTWKTKLKQALESEEIPASFAVVFEQFSGDFRYTEASVLSLALCNGSLLADTANLVNLYPSPDRPTVTGTTLNDESSSRRPSVAAGDSRSRATSSVTVEPYRPRGLSAHASTASPMIPSPDFGRPSDGFGLSSIGNNVPYNPSSYAPPTGRRIRASSTTSSRTPISPDVPGAWRNYSNGSAMSSNPNRPSTSTGRSYDSPPLTRLSHEASRLSNDRLYPDHDTSRYVVARDSQSSSSHRQSAVFSSAMPMSDSPRTQSPTHDVESPAEFNVLFLAASVYEFNIDRARREAGYPYLTYVAGEIFDVIGEKGELWLAKNQDDGTNQVGWIWNKHFAKLAS